MSKIIDGKLLAANIRANLKERSLDIAKRLGRAPALAVILVGSNPASQVYVQAKTKAGRECGITIIDKHLSDDSNQTQLIQTISELNNRKEVDGILLQLPLPKTGAFDEFEAIKAISPQMDVDGLHPLNQGLLLRGAEGFRSCTPLGVMRLIDEALRQLGVSSNIAGKKAVVIGRSILVGKPLGFLLLERNCTVTMCHSRTQNIEEECRSADILVAAVGVPEFVKGSWVKQGAIVIDVGINRTEAGKIVGDIQFNEVEAVASAITPVPGGVGPMTIAMLLSNTVDSAERKIVP